MSYIFWPFVLPPLGSKILEDIDEDTLKCYEKLINFTSQVKRLLYIYIYTHRYSLRTQSFYLSDIKYVSITVFFLIC